MHKYMNNDSLDPMLSLSFPPFNFVQVYDRNIVCIFHLP